MKRVLMALAVVGFMAAPLFADFDVNSVPPAAATGFTTLVYTVSGNMSGWEFSNAAATLAEEDNTKINGYVVVDVNTATLVTANQVDVSDEPNDSNALNNTTLIVLGKTASVKKAFAIVLSGGAQEADEPNFVGLNFATAAQPIFTNNDKSKEFVVDASFEASTSKVFDLKSATSMFGWLGNVTLGTNKIPLPKSLKAAGELETFDPTGTFEEDDLPGNITLSLNSGYTKNNYAASVFIAVQAIKADLIKKKYTQVSINDFFNGL